MTSCKEPYDPSIEAGITNYLVVEGFIHTNGVSTIQMSRTQRLAEMGLIRNEVNAELHIEGENGSSFPLTETSDGVYRSEDLDLPADDRYRLRIKTSGGKEYLSEFSTVTITPEANVSWELNNAGAGISVSTSDPANQTHYYQWAFEETWEQRSEAHSEFQIEQTFPVVTIDKRPDQDQIDAYRCWSESFSSDIFITSTAALSQDAVDKFSLIQIPNGSDKLAVRYSVLVKQYALDRTAYEFFELMKKNSQQLGSVFDPQPTAVRGNIKSTTDPEEPVIGYIIASSASEKRIFITGEEAGNWTFLINCGDIMVPRQPDSLNKYFRGGTRLIRTGEWDNSCSICPLIIGYWAVSPPCVDCRTRGGISRRPEFW